MIIENNENLEQCAKCDVKCCSRCGCELSVEDFTKKYGEVTIESVSRALRDGDLAIDWWEGDIRRNCLDSEYKDTIATLPEQDDFDLDCLGYRNRCHYLRMRHVGEASVAGSYGGVCVALTPSGCKYSWEDRPTGGKAKPVGVLRPGDTCDVSGMPCAFDKINSVVEWFKYESILNEVSQMDEFCHNGTRPDLFSMFGLFFGSRL